MSSDVPALSSVNFFKQVGIMVSDRGATFYKIPLEGTGSTTSKMLLIETYIEDTIVKVYFRFLNKEELKSPLLRQIRTATDEDKRSIRESIKNVIYGYIKNLDSHNQSYNSKIQAIYVGTEINLHHNDGELEEILQFSIADTVKDMFYKAIEDDAVTIKDGFTNEDIHNFSSSIATGMWSMGLDFNYDHELDKAFSTLEDLIKEEDWESKDEQINDLREELDKAKKVIELLLKNPRITSEDLLKVKRGRVTRSDYTDEEMYLLYETFFDVFGELNYTRGNPESLVQKRNEYLESH